MPVYKFSLIAKVNICMDGATPEEAAANLQSLMEDAYVSNPHGFELKFGLYPSTVWVQGDPPKMEQQMPEGYDPQNPPRMTMKRWMEMCFSDPGDDGENTTIEDIQKAQDGAMGEDLPLANKEELLKKKD